MFEDQSPQSLTRKETKELRRSERRLEQESVAKTRQRKGVALWAVGCLATASVIGGTAWYIASRPSLPEEGIIAKRGLHWHSQLAIKIRGVEQEVPTNIGLGAVHNPIHTHEDLGTIHMEMQGLVTEDDIRLARFFEVWGKPFSTTCVLDVCNGPDGTLRMLVNGSESAEFGSYIMQDKDKIEIIYE